MLDADLLEWIMRRQLRVAAPAPGAAQHLFPRQRRPVMFLEAERGGFRKGVEKCQQVGPWSCGAAAACERLEGCRARVDAGVD